MGGCIDWYLYGEWDHEAFAAKLREYSPIFAGAVFGGAWWVLVDAVTYSRVVLHESFPWTYTLPGVAATLALIFMNLVSREELANMSDSATYTDEHAPMRARCWLFFSYMVAFGAIAGAVAVLLNTTGGNEHVGIGVGGLIQTGLIIFSGLLFWAFRTPSEDGYYIG